MSDISPVVGGDRWVATAPWADAALLHGARPSRRSTATSTSATLGVSEPLDVFVPGLALTLVRPSKAIEGQDVLVGVRTKDNVTHEGVLSVPTVRVPNVLAERWKPVTGARMISADEIRSRPWLVADLAYVIENLLARKLGVADALEHHEVAFRVESLLALQGESLIGVEGDTEIVEKLTMFCAQVRWDEGNDVPRSTAAYDPLLWVPEDRFADMVRTRDVSALDAGLDAIDVCVRGLCIDGAARSLGVRQR